MPARPPVEPEETWHSGGKHTRLSAGRASHSLSTVWEACGDLNEAHESVSCLLPKLTISTGHSLSGLSGLNVATRTSHWGPCPRVHGDSVILFVQRASEQRRAGGLLWDSEGLLHARVSKLNSISPAPIMGSEKGRQLG